MHARIFGLASGLVVASSLASAQAPPPPAPMTVWAPRPMKPGLYAAPQRPRVRLADLMARHADQPDWRELVVDDGHLQGEYVSSGPGQKTASRFHPDTRVWWVVLDGEMRVEIEGQAPLVAGKGSLVQVPKQTLYNTEVTSDRPCVRFEVNVSKAKTLYPQATQAGKPAPVPGFDWVAMTIRRRPAPYDGGNQPQVDLSEGAHASGNNTRRVLHDDRLEVLNICGQEKNLPPLDPKDRGHVHPESVEFWLVSAGQIRYDIETVPVFVADEGDLVYVPAGTFHLARFAGAGPSCRLSITEYPNNAQLLEIRDR